MELVEQYLSRIIIKFAMWIADIRNEVMEVKCQFNSIQPHPFYPGKYELFVHIEDSVLNVINLYAAGWDKKICVFVTQNGNGIESFYKLLSCKFQPYLTVNDNTTIWEMVAIVEFYPEEEKENDPSGTC